MKEAIIEILKSFKIYNSTGIYWILFIFGMIYIFVVMKNLRRKYLYPTIMLMLIVINPLLYKFIWFKLLNTTYWRIFWGLASIILISIVVIDISKKLANKSKKYGAIVQVLFTLGVVTFIGVYGMVNDFYAYSGKVYQKKQNEYNLPQEAIDVADCILKLNQNPRVIMPRSLYCYIRQYDSNIKMMYGRDIQGYIMSATSSAYIVNSEMSKTQYDYNLIKKYCIQENYDFVIFEKDAYINTDYFKKIGFELVSVVDKYAIFRYVE